jgi:hypothetical protein
MMNMTPTFEQYCKGAALYLDQNPALRPGQAYYNYLTLCGLDRISNLLPDELDPYYDNTKLNRFLQFVQQEMSEWESMS